MIKFGKYLTDEDKENYRNPVTGETWEQEQERVKAYKRNQRKVNAGANIESGISSLVGLIPLFILIGLILHAFI